MGPAGHGRRRQGIGQNQTRRHRLRFRYPSQRPCGRFAPSRECCGAVGGLPPPKSILPIILGPRRGRNGVKMSDLGSNMEPNWI